MKKGSYDTKNYGYIYCKADEYEFPLFVGDTMQDVADYLGVNLSVISRMYARGEPRKNFTKFKIERVQLYDYVCILYEKDIYHPLCVALNLNELARKSGFSKSYIATMLYTEKKLFRKYNINRIDLFAYEQSYSNYIKECLKVDKITQSYMEYMGLSEDIKEI